MGEIVTVNFRGDDLCGFKRDDGTFVALKPLVEGMGVQWEAQRQRIQRDPVLSEGTCIMQVPFGRGGPQDMLCIKLELVNGWLFGIDTHRIKDEAVRERVILYQRECYQVLHDHFSGRRTVVEVDGEPNEELSTSEKMRLCDMVHRGFGTMAFRQIYFKMNLPRVPEMYRPEQNDLFHYGMIRQEAA